MRFGVPSRLALRIALPALAVAALALAALYYRQGLLAERRSAETLDRYAGLLSNLVLHDLRDSMLRKERPRIQRELADVARLGPIRSVQVVAKSGKVTFASDPTAVGRVVAKSSASCAACHQDGAIPTTGARSLHIEIDGRPVFRALQPIVAARACVRCHEVPVGTMVGLLVTDLDGPALVGGVATDRAQTVALGALRCCPSLQRYCWRCARRCWHGWAAWRTCSTSCDPGPTPPCRPWARRTRSTTSRVPYRP